MILYKLVLWTTWLFVQYKRKCKDWLLIKESQPIYVGPYPYPHPRQTEEPFSYVSYTLEGWKSEPEIRTESLLRLLFCHISNKFSLKKWNIFIIMLVGGGYFVHLLNTPRIKLIPPDHCNVRLFKLWNKYVSLKKKTLQNLMPKHLRYLLIVKTFISSCKWHTTLMLSIKIALYYTIHPFHITM